MDGLGSAIETIKAELQNVSRTADAEIESVARVFAGLAGEADAILQVAAAIVSRVESGDLRTVLARVQALCTTVVDLNAGRLEVTAGILDAVKTEAALLGQLSGLIRGQEAIALQTKALSVLTNIEVARLGSVGEGFQYLAHELSDFSTSVAKDTQGLANHTESRKSAIEATKQTLSTNLPRLRKELERIQGDLVNGSAAIEASLGQLSTTPAEFKACVETIAQLVSGVVAAVQAHDITRQQLEHVVAGLELVASGSGLDLGSKDGTTDGRAKAYAGLLIQIHQLTVIKQTVAAWAAQITTCTERILEASTAEVVALGPMVLDRERDVSVQLAQIERVQQESRTQGERIRSTLGGLSSLLQLVSEHLDRSKSIRDHLRLLTFNSIIEASRLGVRADAILAIARTIKGVSADWTVLTDQSGLARTEILKLVERTNELAAAFSEAGDAKLRETQAETEAALESVRTAATFVDTEAREMHSITEKMQAMVVNVRQSVDVLAACFGRFDSLRRELERVVRQLEVEDPDIKTGYDPAEVEHLFSESYTSESERKVLQAVLRGTNLPPVQESFAGNSVELF